MLVNFCAVVHTRGACETPSSTPQINPKAGLLQSGICQCLPLLALNWHTRRFKSGIGGFDVLFALKFWLGDRVACYGRYFPAPVGERSLIRVLLPFENGNTSRKDAQENRNRNRVRFFWPTWFVVTRQLNIFSCSFCVRSFKFYGVCSKPLERPWNYLSNSILHTPKFLKFQSLNQNQQRTHTSSAIKLKVLRQTWKWHKVTLWRAYATF